MNTFTEFFSHPLHAEIAMLLVLGPLDEKEKRTWLEKLPFMNEEEKNVLRDNLRETFNTYAQAENLGVGALLEKIKGGN